MIIKITLKMTHCSQPNFAGWKKEKVQFTLLSCKTKAILLGSLLGDGSLKIHKGYKNARFSFKHSIKQESYALWKGKNLMEVSNTGTQNAILGAPKSILKHEETAAAAPKGAAANKESYGKHKTSALLLARKKQSGIIYQSKALESLTYLYHLTHKNKSFQIKRKWLNLMTPLSLAIWWCDDGSLVSNTKQGVFCTDGFDLKDIKILDRYMKKIWNINTSIHFTGLHRKSNKKRYRLWMRNRENLKKFLIIIIPFIPVKEMIYKILILYKDPEEQQRWISTIINAGISNEMKEVLVKTIPALLLASKKQSGKKKESLN